MQVQLVLRRETRLRYGNRELWRVRSFPLSRCQLISRLFRGKELEPRHLCL